MTKLGKVGSIFLVFCVSFMAVQPLTSNVEAEPDKFEDANLSLSVRFQDWYFSVLWHAERDGMVERLGFLNWRGENLCVGDWLRVETDSLEWELVPSFSFSSELIDISLFEREVGNLSFNPGSTWELTEGLTSELAERVISLAVSFASLLIPDRVGSVVIKVLKGLTRALPDFGLLESLWGIFGDITDSFVGLVLSAAMLMLYYPVSLFLLVSLDTPFALFEEGVLCLFGLLTLSGPLLSGLKIEDLCIFHGGVNNLEISFSELSVAHLFSVEDFRVSLSDGGSELEGEFSSSLLEMGANLKVEPSFTKVSDMIFELRAGDNVLFLWSGMTFFMDLRSLFDFIERKGGKTSIQFGVTLFDAKGDLDLTVDLFP